MGHGMAQNTADNRGWAGFAAPEDGWGLIVPLSGPIMDAGAPLAERAHDRALERYGDLGVAQDILAGNALLAVHDDRKARAAVAACLGGIAKLTQSHAFVVTVVKRGNGMDCHVERLDRQCTEPDQRLRTVRARLGHHLNVPADTIRSGEIVESRP